MGKSSPNQLSKGSKAEFLGVGVYSFVSNYEIDQPNKREWTLIMGLLYPGPAFSRFGGVL